MGAALTENWPEFCFEGNRVSIPRMISGLRRYGYIKEKDGAYDVHSSLKQDYPELFEFIMGYMIQTTATRVAKALDEKKVRTTFDEEGNRRYEFEEDAFELD